MPGVQKSLKLPPETLREIEQMARESGKDFSAVAKDLLEEAIKMRRCPGIAFVEGTSGRRARDRSVGGYRDLSERKKRLCQAPKNLSLVIARTASGSHGLLFCLSSGN